MNTLSGTPGISISSDEKPNCQITAVTEIGLWLLVGDEEYFVPFAEYPHFQTALLDQIFAVEWIAPGQVRWEALDIDIELDALMAPDRYPLVWQ